MKSEDISRRSFLKRAAALSAAAAIPSFWIPSKANAMPVFLLSVPTKK